MTTPVVVVGAGGFGRESLDVISAMNREHNDLDVLGVVDSNPSDLNLDRLRSREVPYLGTESEWLSLGIDASFVIAIGNPSARRAVASRWLSDGRTTATLIHPSAVIGSCSTVGEGSVVCAGVQVSTNVTIGNFVTVNPNATIGHDTTIASFVSINPGSVISGDVTLRSGTLIGAGAVILQGLTVAEDCLIGAAACVTRDVEARTTAIGVPARPLRSDPS